MKGCLRGFISLSEVGLSLIQSINSKEATIQSNNSKWVLIRSFKSNLFLIRIFVHNSNYSVLYSSNFHLIQSKTLPMNDFELTMPDL